MKRKFSLGVITDEVTQDIFEAAQFCKKYGLDCMEVRSVNDRSPFDFLDSDIDEMKKAADTNGLKLCAISSPLYKCDIDDETAVTAHKESFRICAEHAKKLDAKFIRGFDFWDNGSSVADRAEKYKAIAKICEEYDIYCVIESDPSVHAATPEKLAELLGEINHPRIRALFDPGNEVWVTGKASENAYELLKPYLAHIHIKDADIIDGKPDAVKVGTGRVDYKALFSRLISDGYTGSVMLETHYRLRQELTEEQLKRPGGSSFSLGAMEASAESITELIKIINSCEEE